MYIFEFTHDFYNITYLVLPYFIGDIALAFGV